MYFIYVNYLYAIQVRVDRFTNLGTRRSLHFSCYKWHKSVYE